VVHVSPDSRKASHSHQKIPDHLHEELQSRRLPCAQIYVGEECDLTGRGGSIMGFCKSWRSLPIRSWSGGMKLADMPGARANRTVRSQLSDLLAPQEPGFVQAAEQLWDAFAAHAATAAAAARMLAGMAASPGMAASALGRTGWNAYSFNLDYRTGVFVSWLHAGVPKTDSCQQRHAFFHAGRHLDGKNTPGSYSALAVFETGAPFQGGFYMLPQCRTALDLRQGVLLLHRSGDAVVGLHGNTGLALPEPGSHRLAVVLYQTQLKCE
jgi:hypothetical protein